MGRLLPRHDHQAIGKARRSARNGTIGHWRLILTEVLQGFSQDREFNEAKRLLRALDFVVLGGSDVAVEAAKNFRRLRAKGVTVRKTIDTVIATRCIVTGLDLLHNDRDFDPYQEHLGLRVVDCEI